MGKEKKERKLKVVMVDVQLMRKGGLKKSFVIPGHREANVGDIVTWKLKGTGAVFYFPKKELFGEKEYHVKKGKELSLSVQEVPKGKYPYAVFTDNDDFAEGESFPRMIIK